MTDVAGPAPLTGRREVPEQLRAIARDLRPATDRVTDGAGAWLVGGVVRDALLGRDLPDIDIVVPDGQAESVARAWARASGGAPFPLGDRFGCWRVTAPPAAAGQPAATSPVGTAQVDVCNLRGGSIEADLALRDLTINAMAVRCDAAADAESHAAIVDPHDGLLDLDRRTVRMVAPAAFDDDPLRMVRVARFAHALGFEVDAATAAAVRERAIRANDPAGERTFEELGQLLLAPESRRAMRLLDELGLLDELLPELAACRNVEQSRFHHLDVFEHTLAVLDNVEDVAAAPDHYFGDAGEPFSVQSVLVLRLAALAHDLAKPATRIDRPDGRVGFPGHDSEGVAIAVGICDRWRTSRAVRDATGKLVRTHLELGMLLHHPVGPRESYRFRRALEPWTAEAIVLSVADRLATAGLDDRRRWVRRHLELAGRLWRDHWQEQRTGRPEPLLDGLGVAAAAGIEPGPALAPLVAALAEEQAVGAVTTVAQAEEFLAARGTPAR